jgi:hypothetical protein
MIELSVPASWRLRRSSARTDPNNIMRYVGWLVRVSDLSPGQEVLCLFCSMVHRAMAHVGKLR